MSIENQQVNRKTKQKNKQTQGEVNKCKRTPQYIEIKRSKGTAHPSIYISLN